MFRGVTTLNLDVKGRIAIPARYRERLAATCASQLVITLDKDRCLLLYPENEWVQIERKLNDLANMQSTNRTLQRLYIGYAYDVEMDGQGRILVPPELREFAGLDKRVALVGQVNKFELWDADVWTRTRDLWLSQVEQGVATLSKDLENLSI